VALTTTIVDDFDDDSIDTGIWSDNYGTVTETGGRARVNCDISQYSAYATGTAYSLEGGHVLCRVYPPAVGGATDTAYASILVVTSTAGTYAGISIDVVSSGSGAFIGAISTVGYADPNAVYVAYDSTDHAWVRIREDSGTIYWETSPDGTVWSQLRSDTAPSWVSDTDLSVALEAHRGSGTDDYAEYDSFNAALAAPAAVTAAAGDPAAGVSPAASAASASAAARDATVEVGASPQAAAATAAAGDPTTTITPAAAVAGGTAAVAASPSVGGAATPATATGAAEAGTAVVAPTPATATGIARPGDPGVTVAAGRPDTGSWYALLDILREGAEEVRRDRSTPPSACPNDGEPLQTGPRGQLHCPFDGYIWRG
jgi:hypothetical protein